MHEDVTGVAGNALTVLLNDLLTSQRQILSSMVTKEDLQSIKRDWQVITDDHESRISAIEANRLPKWFWPTAASALGAVGTVLGWFLEHANHGN